MPWLSAPAVCIFEFVVGLLVLVGWWTRLAALVLAAFSVGASYLGHYGAAQGTDMTAILHWQAFIKDVAVAGGLLLLAGRGAGRISVDAYLKARGKDQPATA